MNIWESTIRSLQSAQENSGGSVRSCAAAFLGFQRLPQSILTARAAHLTAREVSCTSRVVQAGCGAFLIPDDVEYAAGFAAERGCRTYRLPRIPFRRQGRPVSSRLPFLFKLIGDRHSGRTCAAVKRIFALYDADVASRPDFGGRAAQGGRDFEIRRGWVFYGARNAGRCPPGARQTAR